MQFGTAKRKPIQKFAAKILSLIGWTMVTELPDVPKYIVVAAPHTSNWDLPLGLTYAIAAGLKFHWIGKDEAFRWPLGGLMRALGGLPVNRRSNNNFVDQIVSILDQRDELVMAITPAGTRGEVGYWKTGFYYIALGAGIPIALGYLDYGTKTIGIEATLWPSGDLEADIRKFQEFYAGKVGKHADRQQLIRIRPRTIDAN